MKEFKKILEYAKEYRSKMGLATGLIFMSVICSIAPYVLVGRLTAVIIAGELSMSYLVVTCLSTLMLLGMKGMFFYKGLGASHDVAFDTLMGMRTKFADKMLNQSLGHINDKGMGAYKQFFVEDIDKIEVFLAHIIPEGVPYIGGFVLAMLALFIIDWRMGLLALGTLPLGLIAMTVMFQIGMKKMDNYYQSCSEMSSMIVEYVTGMEVVKIFGHTDNSYRRFESSVENYRTYTLDWFRSNWPYMAIYMAILPCTLLFMLPGSLIFYHHGTITVDTMLVCYMLGLSLGPPLIKLMNLLPSFPQLIHKVRALEEAFDAEALVKGTISTCPSHHTIEMKHVTFAYDETIVLDDINLTFHENQLTAIVGESGSGKSTITKLLINYYNVKQGDIYIGGINTKDMTFENLMDQISYVAQDNFLFDMSIKENIAIGKPNATDQEIIRAAEMATCHDFIVGLEKGYDTGAGDAGSKLSGGQLQRITLARAILKDAPIIILDEATAYVDGENERLIRQAIQALTSEKTVIVIAHKLATILDAHQIVVVHDGKINQVGTHESLVNNNVVYQNLWQAYSESVHWMIDTKGVDND